MVSTYGPTLSRTEAGRRGARSSQEGGVLRGGGAGVVEVAVGAETGPRWPSGRRRLDATALPTHPGQAGQGGASTAKRLETVMSDAGEIRHEGDELERGGFFLKGSEPVTARGYTDKATKGNRRTEDREQSTENKD